MMEEMGKYILSVAAAAVIFGIVASFTDGKSSAGAFVKLIGGLYLTIIVIQPVVKFDLNAVSAFLEDFSVNGEEAVSEGKKLASQAMADIIKSETEAYILDKAGLYHAQIDVEVETGQEEVPVPVAVIIRGTVSQDVKQQLENIIETELEIPKENQTWIGTP